MTIEEMIEALESGYTAHATAQTIISALRAGQAMRKKCYSDEPGAQAWDAALGEKE